MMRVKYSNTRILILDECRFRILQKQAEMSRLFNVRDSEEKKQRCPTFSMFRAVQKQAELSRLFNVRDSEEKKQRCPTFSMFGKSRILKPIILRKVRTNVVIQKGRNLWICVKAAISNF
jgi:hypothetical protein